ncbi:hypothetical protein [Thiofilum flexile]|uniref:hypothetical protein n=1 Tax=Thiofilum flexile TaxID=125627 RepID=UPI000363075A|nr:hypothetical protein [Thiofilum flexile]
MNILTVSAYQRWQQVVFWLSWLGMLVPGYILTFGTFRMAQLVWNGYQDRMDWLMLAILALGAFSVVLTAILTYWAYRTASRGYWNLMFWQIVGLVGIPLIVMLACIGVYFQLELNGVLPNIPSNLRLAH